MVVCVDFSNIFFISFSMFKKQLFEKNGEDYVIQEEDLGLYDNYKSNGLFNKL